MFSVVFVFCLFLASNRYCFCSRPFFVLCFLSSILLWYYFVGEFYFLLFFVGFFFFFSFLLYFIFLLFNQVLRLLGEGKVDYHSERGYKHRLGINITTKRSLRFRPVLTKNSTYNSNPLWRNRLTETPARSLDAT